MKWMVASAMLLSLCIMHSSVVAGPGLCRANASAPLNREGKDVPCSEDLNGNTRVTQGTTTAGEDPAVDVVKTESRFSYRNITLAAPTTTNVKTNTGLLHAITINKTTANGVITCYDNTVAAAPIIALITQPAAVLESMMVLLYDVVFGTALTCVTSGAAQDITISYR